MRLTRLAAILVGGVLLLVGGLWTAFFAGVALMGLAFGVDNGSTAADVAGVAVIGVALLAGVGVCAVGVLLARWSPRRHEHDAPSEPPAVEPS